MFAYMFTHISGLAIVVLSSYYFFYYFFSVLRNFSTHSLKIGLLVKKFFLLSCIWECLYLPFIPEGSFT